MSSKNGGAQDIRTVYRICTICEALCGLELEVKGSDVTSVRGDAADVLSKGHICPKGVATAEFHHDQDKLTRPMRRTANGDFEPIPWDTAMTLVAERLQATRRDHGADAVALYIGDPIIHNYGALALRAGLIRALGSKNVSSASSQDTAPRFATSFYLYGLSVGTPVPDIDRTDYLLCIGANPRVSNGSVLGAPGIRDRLKRLADRGGKLVVVDPRRTETAKEASEYVSIRPGGDAALLLAMVRCLLEEGLAQRDDLAEVTTGFASVEAKLAAFTPEAVSAFVGIDAATIRRLAREFANAKTAAAYSRIGVCNNVHGTIATYATDLLNIVAGRLGKPGGSLFPQPVADTAPILKWTGDGHDRWQSRVRGLPETLGDLPASTLAEEIETPGSGQVRALVTFAGNPVLSTPNGRRLERAIEQLDFMVAIDPYINETTQHADVILPPATSLSEEVVNLLSSRYAVRTIARYSPAAVPCPAGERPDWEILLDLIYRLGGGPVGIARLDAVYRWGRHVGFHWTPEKTADLLIRMGPHGDKFLPWNKGLNLKKVKKATHGIDLGPLPEGTKHGVLHRDGKVHLDAPPILAGIDDVAEAVKAHGQDKISLLLIGRRELRSINSWMHNLPSLVSGKPRCTLMVHPDDATRLKLSDGKPAIMSSAVHRAEVPVQVTDEVRPGVVSLPHGWGHATSARWQKVAGAHAGVSANDWTDDARVESVVGQSILNGVPVQLEPVTTAAKAPGSEAATV